ncbi:MAG: hypothetical protein KC912_06870 [Proteobacteria bacterium]|nr:hypothetical protein [Pseudomonadota bacterium]
MTRLLPLLVLLGCADASSEDDSENALPQPVALAELSNGACPDLTVTGSEVSFTSADVERSVRVYLPAGETTDAPLLFMWHPLGVSAAEIAQYTDAQTLANDLGMVILVPLAIESNTFEWEFAGNGSDQDIVLYDDLRTCAANDLGIDVRRVYTTGMSAGALWSTYLTMHRADTLAASLIMSGGTGAIIQYESPEAEVPVLMFYGGATDTWGGGGFTVDFTAATLEFADDVADDIETLILCNHNRGHVLPPSGMATVESFLLRHAYGEPSPFADGDLNGLPTICEMAW